MTRLSPVKHETANEPARALLDGVQAKLGMTPNLMSTMAHSAAALDGYLKLSDALSRGALKGPVREQIALAVAQANSCDYCLSAHSSIAKMLGLTKEEIQDARLAHSEDVKTKAMLKLSTQIVEARGKISDEDLEIARAAGITEEEITEVVANTALNLLTNYFNHVAQTEIDFPVAEPLSTAEACSTC